VNSIDKEEDVRLKVAANFVDDYEELRELFDNTQKLTLAAISFAIKEGLEPISHKDAGGRSNKEIIMGYIYRSEQYAEDFLRVVAWAQADFSDEAIMPDYSQYQHILEGYLNAGVQGLGKAMREEDDAFRWYLSYLKSSMRDE
jgi:hypothetical protein